MAKKAKQAPDTGADAELELKLDIDPADIAALRAAAPFAEAGALDRAQRSVYFDTPDHALHTAGFSLRVRAIGDRRIQTVKADAAAAAGLFVRPEWEMDIDGDRPVVDDATPLGTLLSSADRSRVTPAFTVAVTRTTVMAERGDATIEAVLDQGEIAAGDATEAVCEVELELKAGDPQALFALAREIDRTVPVRLGVLSKSERGYRLGAPTADKPVKSVPLALAAGMDAAAGFRAIVGACLRQFRLNEAIIGRTGDPGALHQARVALRRLRSALSTFKPLVQDGRVDQIRGEVRWIAGELGEARNLDVMIGRVPAGPARDPLLAARDGAYDAVGAALASPRARAALLDLAEWAAIGPWTTDPARAAARAQPIETFAAAALDRHRRRLKRLGRHLDAVGDDERHEARIEAKKLRYATEFFAGTFPGRKPARRHAAFLKALEALQAHLGDLNDIATAPLVLAELGLAGTPVATALQPDPALRTPLIAEAADAHDTLMDAKRFWR